MKTKIVLVMAMLVVVLSFGADKVNAIDYVVENEHYDQLDLWSGDTLLMNGGDIWQVNSYDNSESNIHGGVILQFDTYHTSILDLFDGGKLNYLDAHNQSDLCMSGGELLYFNAFDSSTASLSGGVINNLAADDESIIDIYGYGFAFDSSGGSYPGGLFTGFWPDDTTFSIDLFDRNSITYDHIVSHEIPEPGMLSLFLFGSVGMLRKKRICMCD